MTQNEKFRIIIDIDDRDLRTLNNTLQDLNDSLNDLSEAISNSVGNIKDITNEMRPLERITKLSSDTFKTFETSLKLTVMPMYMIKNHLTDIQENLDRAKVATNGMTGALTLKTTYAWLSVKALTAMKIAMKALPFIGLVSMALSLISTLGRLFSRTNETSDATDEFASNLEQLELRLARNREAHESNMRSIVAQGRATENLIKQILELNNSAADCTETQARLLLSTILLNSSTDEFGVSIDEVTGLLDENSKATLESAHEQNVLNTAYREQETTLAALWDAHGDKNYALLKMNEAYADLQHRLDDYRSELEELLELDALTIISSSEKSERFNYFANMLGMTVEELLELDMAQSDYLFTVEDTSINLHELCDTLEEWQVVLNDSQERIEELEFQLIESFDNMENATVESIQNQVLSFDDLSRAQQSVVTELNRTFNNYVDQLRGANGKIRVDNEFTADHWRRTMEHNQLVMSGWADNVDKLTDRISDEMMDYIRFLGPEHAHLVQDLVNMSATELAEMETVFKNNCQVAGQAALAGLDSASIPVEVANLIFESERSMSDAIRDANFQELGLNLAEGLRDGIKDGEILVGAGAAALAREAEKAVREESETNSPSKVFDRIGQDLVGGLVQGIEAIRNRPVDRLENLTQTMQRVYSNTEREYTTIGRQIMTGLNQGLLNGENQVMATANRIAQNIARTMRQALDINSPSRLMREQIGRQIPAGIGEGIDKYADVAIDSVYKLGHDLVKLNLPSVESMIGLGPSMRLAGAGDMSNSGNTINDHYTVNNKGLFEGATINWHGEEDIRRTMEKIAWATEQDRARMW